MDVLIEAFVNVTQPLCLLMLVTGVGIGLVVGAVPGIGGIFGLVMVIPFTFQLDPYAAFALLLGLSAVITTSDTIPAVLIGVPGSVGAIATVEDGHPLAQQGQAARALGAAYSASMLGGIFGALVLGLSIPVIRPLILSLQTPDFLAVALIGLIFVAFISGKDLLKGVAALLLGMLLSFVGLDPHSGAERFTFDLVYLWGGIPLAILFLGLFALPEMAALLQRGRVSDHPARIDAQGLWGGVRETLAEWRLVLACSSVGALIGAIPGVGVTVIDWVAYGIARRFHPAGPVYGQGNIAGVIAPESANNAKEGGYLIPTLALGLPGSATMTILLAAFTVHGLVPGPEMLGKNLPLTYAMVMFLVLANILGTGTCLLLTRHLAALTTIPASRIVPVALVLITLGAFQTNGRLADIVVLCGAGALGVAMKSGGWSRAAFSLGFVLGPTVERYAFLSYKLHGSAMFLRPSLVLAALAILAIIAAWAWQQRREGSRTAAPETGWAGFAALFALALAAVGLLSGLNVTARSFPVLTAVGLMVIAGLGLLRGLRAGTRLSLGLPPKPVLITLGLCLTLTGLLYLCGLAAAAAVFTLMTISGAERRFSLSAACVALVLSGLVVVLFEKITPADWPAGVIWSLFG
jgi:TctA family transporter